MNGTSASDVLTVNVAQANPGQPVLSNDNWAGTTTGNTMKKKNIIQEGNRQWMGFISNKYTCGFAVAWGMVYVYDFLYKHEYISDKVYNNALEVIDGIKAEIIKGYVNSLWEYDFIHAWEKPDSISDEEFTVEKDLFDDSFKGQIEILDDLTFNDMIEEDNDNEEE